MILTPTSRIALAYELLNPLQACRAFSRGIGRPVRYERSPIDIAVSIPAGYREQLEALEALFSPHNPSAKLQPPYFGDEGLEASCPNEALRLWEGYRGLEEYAREVFPLEEAANGRRWMDDDVGDDGRGGRGEEEWLA